MKKLINNRYYRFIDTAISDDWDSYWFKDNNGHWELHNSDGPNTTPWEKSDKEILEHVDNDVDLTIKCYTEEEWFLENL